jgi:serine/threonine protein kinase
MTYTNDQRIGTRFARHRIESLAGIGGLARVYKAVDDEGRCVALKIVNDEVADDQPFRRRFAREARIARTVSNPHLVPVLDIGEHEGLPYLTQPFVEGDSLEGRLEREGRLEPAEAARICAEVAIGLQALSDAGIVHRDVKPANILLDRHDRVYVTDFGLAKDTNDVPLTEPGNSVGTIRYIAPEQIRCEPVTAATDVYSLACVMFECVQGRPPFDHDDVMRIMWAHLHDDPPHADRAPASFARALETSLHKDPGKRPQTCAQLARELLRACDLVG